MYGYDDMWRSFMKGMNDTLNIMCQCMTQIVQFKVGVEYARLGIECAQLGIPQPALPQLPVATTFAAPAPLQQEVPIAVDVVSKVDEFAVGQIWEGRVNKLHKGGANVTIGDYFGFVPKGQISQEWVDEVSDHLHVGQRVNVKVIGVDRDKEMVTLSIKKAPQPLV